MKLLTIILCISWTTVINAQTSSPTTTPTRVPTRAPTSQTQLPFNWAMKYPKCIGSENDIVYRYGQVAMVDTFRVCLNNITDVLGLPIFYSGSQRSRVQVNTTIQLNNLHEVDAIAGTVTVDFYWRLMWYDNRFNMPDFWAKLPNSVRRRGVDINMLLDAGALWVPDIRFHDVTDLNVLISGIRINASNWVFWTRHVLATFIQPKLNFQKYPADDQTFHLRYGSFIYDQNTLVMGFPVDSAILSLNRNFDNSFSFESNPLWKYNAEKSSYTFYVSGSNFHNVIYNIALERQASGIIYRLMLPMTLIIILSGATFWAATETRVDTVITLLLAVSALYIVILGNIPLVGYLTDFDTYVFWMFVLLILVIILHQGVATLVVHEDKFPLRILMIRIFELAGRVIVIPLVIFFYVYQVKGQSETQQEIFYVIGITFPCIVLVLELPRTKKCITTTIKALMKKLENENSVSITRMEIIAFNFIKYRVISMDMTRVLEYRHNHKQNMNEKTIEKPIVPLMATAAQSSKRILGGFFSKRRYSVMTRAPSEMEESMADQDKDKKEHDSDDEVIDLADIYEAGRDEIKPSNIAMRRVVTNQKTQSDI
jgi:hypothetical protein